MSNVYIASALVCDNENRAYNARLQYEQRKDAELRANLFEMKHNINRLLEYLDNPNDD